MSLLIRLKVEPQQEKILMNLQFLSPLRIRRALCPLERRTKRREVGEVEAFMLAANTYIMLSIVRVKATRKKSNLFQLLCQ